MLVPAARARTALVVLSQWLANPSHPSLATRQSWLTEQLFPLLPDAAHVTLNPGFFADNYVGNGLIGLAAQTGVLPIPLGSGRNAPPSNEDIARAAAAVLRDPAAHHGRRYRPTGPELLTSAEIAAAVGEAVGRRVRHVDMPMPMFPRALRVRGSRTGIDTAQIATVRWYYDESRLGTWEIAAPTTHVPDVTGQPAEDFRAIARHYAARPEVRRTMGNRARAAWDLVRIGFTPTPRLDRWVRSRREPVPPVPEFSRDSAVWLAEHAPT
ncbi:MAG: hypothetical protein ACFCVF_17180 [Kineosporiaceae bacterium]